jgi:MFS family permease
VDLIAQVLRPDFVRPVLVLAAATAALSAGVGFLPVLGARQGLGPLATGALVSLLAATAAVLQPYSGRRIDSGRFNPRTASLSLAACAAGFVIAAAFSSIPGLATAAILIGAGVAVATPLGFTLLARSSPAERMGRTMGAAEVGRELGDAGGPVLVGAFSLVSLTAGLGALALALLACAGLVLPRNTRQAADRS